LFFTIQQPVYIDIDIDNNIIIYIDTNTNINMAAQNLGDNKSVSKKLKGAGDSMLPATLVCPPWG
jgi:hypothetical protein